MRNDYKEVYFENYCNKCAHEKKKENEEPCDECLSHGVNLHSHKPVKFTQAYGGNRKKKN